MAGVLTTGLAMMAAAAFTIVSAPFGTGQASAAQCPTSK